MQMGARSFKLQMRVADKSRFGAGWLMAKAAELSDLVRNESKRLSEKKQMHQNLQQKDISRALFSGFLRPGACLLLTLGLWDGLNIQLQ